MVYSTKMNMPNVTLPENLQLQIIMLAAHDGVTPSQYVAAALAEKVKEVEGVSGNEAPGSGDAPGVFLGRWRSTTT